MTVSPTARHQLCQKAPFARLLAAVQDRDADAHRFWPKTWVFGDSALGVGGGGGGKRGGKSKGSAEGMPTAKDFPLIYKPSDGSQGDGIVLIHSEADLSRKLADPRAALGCVVQVRPTVSVGVVVVVVVVVVGVGGGGGGGGVGVALLPRTCQLLLFCFVHATPPHFPLQPPLVSSSLLSSHACPLAPAAPPAASIPNASFVETILCLVFHIMLHETTSCPL